MNEVAYLIPAEAVTDASGTHYARPNSENARKVYAQIKSIYESEYYTASANGQKVDLKLIVHLEDYQGERYARHDGKLYEVARTYRDGRRMELTLKAVSA